MIGFMDDPDRGARVTRPGGTVAGLDEGDPRTLAAAHDELMDALPGVSIVGGCCGTDARHAAALWTVD